MRLLSNFLIKSSPKSSTFSTRLPPLFAKNISIHGLFSSVYLLIHEHFRKNTKLWTSNSFKPPFKKSCVTNCLFTLSTLDFHIKLKIILSFKWRRYRFIRRGKWNKQTILILQDESLGNCYSIIWGTDLSNLLLNTRIYSKL